MKIDVIIPVYQPGKRFFELLKRLQAQETPVNRLILMNTEKRYWDAWTGGLAADGLIGELPKNMEVFHVAKEDFDHGATRDDAVRLSDADLCVLMTDDALPADRFLIGRLAAVFEENGAAAAAYARQLPDRDCGAVERYARGFNYPQESCVKTKADLETLGIKTYFCSNVCAAYRRETYLELGGFIRKTVFNEDMIFAAKAINAGYSVCYAADAKVIHSHNYTNLQQFHRNFDLAVSQADHPEVFAGLAAEGEGIRLVKQTAGDLIKNGKWGLLPHLVMNSGFKYLGYLTGKRYRRLPKRLILRFTMNRAYWKGYER